MQKLTQNEISGNEQRWDVGATKSPDAMDIQKERALVDAHSI